MGGSGNDSMNNQVMRGRGWLGGGGGGGGVGGVSIHSEGTPGPATSDGYWTGIWGPSQQGEQ